MTFVIPAAHSAAVQAACRIPALHARLGLLAAVDPDPAPYIEFYANPMPDPWNSGIPDPAPTPVVTLTMALGAGIVNEELKQIQFTVPLESQITDADPSTGTTVTWAAIYDGAGVIWGYGTVTDEAGSGDFKLQTALLLNGAYARLTSATMQG